MSELARVVQVYESFSVPRGITIDTHGQMAVKFRDNEELTALRTFFIDVLNNLDLIRDTFRFRNEKTADRGDN